MAPRYLLIVFCQIFVVIHLHLSFFLKTCPVMIFFNLAIHMKCTFTLIKFIYLFSFLYFIGHKDYLASTLRSLLLDLWTIIPNRVDYILLILLQVTSLLLAETHLAKMDEKEKKKEKRLYLEHHRVASFQLIVDEIVWFCWKGSSAALRRGMWFIFAWCNRKRSRSIRIVCSWLR